MMTTPVKLRLAQIVVAVIFLALGIKWSLAAPFNEGPDETAHFQFIRFVAKYGRLPTSGEERAAGGYKADGPPLFHLSAGLVGQGIALDAPPFVKVAQNNPRLQLVVGHGNILAWRALTTEDPFQSETLLWYAGRWVTLGFGLLGVGAIYWLIRAAQPEQPWAAVSAAAMFAFIPTYLRTSAVISYELLLGLLLTGYFWFLLRAIQDPTQNWTCFGLGLLLGLAGLTKYTPWPIILFLPGVVLWLAYRQHRPWPVIIKRMLFVASGLALTIGAWGLYLFVYFNRVSELGWLAGLLQLLIGDGSDATSVQFVGLVSSGQLGGFRYDDSFLEWLWRIVNWGGGWLTWLFLILWAAALAGLVRQWRRFEPQTRSWLLLLAGHFGLLLVLPFLRFWLTGQAATGMAQHILPAAGAALMILLVRGLSAWFKPSYLAGLLVIVAALCLFKVGPPIAQSSRPAWPVRTVPFLEKEQVAAAFGDVALVGYEIATEGPVLKTILYWRAGAFLDRDYYTELTLLDTAGRPQARWVGQPVNGRYPTRAWMPGDRLRDTIYIPAGGVEPGDYQVQLRLLHRVVSVQPSSQPSIQVSYTSVVPSRRTREDAAPLAPEEDVIDLGAVRIAPVSPEMTSTIALNDQEIGYTLWRRGQPQTEIVTYGERATILFSTAERLAETTRLSLVGPDGQEREPIAKAGSVYNFYVEPHFVSGDYRLRFEERSETGRAARVDTDVLLHIQTEARQFVLAEPPPHPLEANFAGRVALLGYDLPQRQVQAGDMVAVTLYWQALRTIEADLIAFNHLIDARQKVWGGNDRLPREIYSTMLWAPGEIVTDHFQLQIDPAAPDGVYNLLVGLYLPVGEAPVSLPLVQDGRMTDVTSVTIGPLKVGDRAPGLTLEQSTPQFLVGQSFGDAPNLTLEGYDIDHPLSLNDRLAENLALRLYWLSEKPLVEDYTVFVHVRTETGGIVAQKDQPPLQGAYPTSLWSPGERIVDEVTIPLPLDLGEGTYQIVVGLYDPQTGQRLSVRDNAANEVRLNVVEVP